MLVKLVDLFSFLSVVLRAGTLVFQSVLLGGVLFVVNMWRRSWRLPTIGIALFAGSAVLIGMIWPAIVQGLQVRPSEQDKEKPYLAANIAATRDAYDIGDDNLEISTYTSKASAQKTTPAQLDAAASSLPIVDPGISHGDVFARFPELKVIICHCGGALDRFVPTDHHLAQKDL